MAQGRLNLMDPPIEDLLDKVDSKFTLVALGALRARQVNAYYNSLGEGLGRIVPPQVASVSGKPLSIAFEEIADAKATYVRLDPDELAVLEEAEGEPTEAELAEVELSGLEGGLLSEVADAGSEVEEDHALDEIRPLDAAEPSSDPEPAAGVMAEDEGPAAG
jgi:DNA-directed RNA polymerase subunit omega